MAPVRGWQFSGLGFEDTEARGPGVTAAGAVAMQSGDALIRQSLMLLLATVPGERVMRPAYGCPLHRLLFQPNDATTAGLAIHYVQQAVQRWEPRVTILKVDAGADPDGPPEVLRISLEYRVRVSQQTDALNLVLDLGGGSPNA